MSEKLLTTAENTKFQDKLVDRMHSELADSEITNDSVIIDMNGISWLDGFADTSFDDTLENCFGIVNRDTLDDRFGGDIECDEPDLSSYYKKAKKLFDNGDDPIDQFLKPSSKNDAKMCALSKSDMVKLYNYMKKQVKKSHFTTDDEKRYNANTADLSALVG